jgi:organic radical activating enzyme
MKTIPVHECFYTWQGGEGVHMGRAAYFIRTFGCPIRCPWCDSAGTWHPDFVPKDIQRLLPDQLVEMATRHKPDFVVVTGGEPTVHDLGPLTDALHGAGLPVHLETSGAFEIRGGFDWVTVSPKWWKQPLGKNIRRANELKIIVEDANSIDRWMDQIRTFVQTTHVWLHPEWSQRENQAVLQSISDYVKMHGPPSGPDGNFTNSIRWIC